MTVSDPSAVDHFFGQPLDGPGKTTGMELRSEFVAPYLNGDLVIQLLIRTLLRDLVQVSPDNDIRLTIETACDKCRETLPVTTGGAPRTAQTVQSRSSWMPRGGRAIQDWTGERR